MCSRKFPTVKTVFSPSQHAGEPSVLPPGGHFFSFSTRSSSLIFYAFILRRLRSARAATCVVLVESRIALSPASSRGTKPSAQRWAVPPRGRTRVVAARLARARTQDPVNPRRGLAPGRGTLHPPQRPSMGAGGTGERVCIVLRAGYTCRSPVAVIESAPPHLCLTKRLHGNRRRACSRGSVVFN